VAKIVKKINRHITVVIGGSHPSMVGAEVLNCPDIDIAVKSEGENTIVELLNAIAAKTEFDSIKGIIYKKNGQIVENAPREFIKDLDSLCFPHEIAPKALKGYNQYPLIAFRNIFTIRGCPHNCNVRFRSPDNIIREIKGLQDIGLKSIHFDDDTFGVNKQYLSNLCNAIIMHCPGLKWSCELHVKLVDEQIISLMKKSGCYSIQIGVESGNNEILKAMRKNITIKDAFAACKIIKRYGIELEAFFIVGFPQETEETLSDTVKAMKNIECDVINYSIFTPYPGTEAFDFCKEKGLISDDYNISLYNHQSPANCFCMNITPERFRLLVSKIEKMVDRKYSLNRLKRVFSSNTIRRIQELGIGKSLERSLEIFLGK
jgi:radical SAM superfamily enzyme YgiQ (UPF0313 family)